MPANLIAEAHLALGDIEAAFPYIEQTFGERLNVVSYFAVEPAYVPVRGDPRFETLLARAGLR